MFLRNLCKTKLPPKLKFQDSKIPLCFLRRLENEFVSIPNWFCEFLLCKEKPPSKLEFQDFKRHFSWSKATSKTRIPVFQDLSLLNWNVKGIHPENLGQWGGVAYVYRDLRGLGFWLGYEGFEG